LGTRAIKEQGQLVEHVASQYQLIHDIVTGKFYAHQELIGDLQIGR